MIGVTKDAASNAVSWWNDGKPMSDSIVLSESVDGIYHLRRMVTGPVYLAHCDIMRDGRGYGCRGYGQILLVNSVERSRKGLTICGFLAPGKGGYVEYTFPYSDVEQKKTVRKAQGVSESNNGRKTKKITTKSKLPISGA